MNKVIIIGNLTRDPELKATASGVSVCVFSVAVNRNHTDANGNREAEFFHRNDLARPGGELRQIFVERP